LPAVDGIATEYGGDVTFLAVAGRSGLAATEAAAARLMPSGAMSWTLDESIWETYEVFGQPVTFAISANGVVVDSWFGLRDDGEIRGVLDQLVGATA